MGLHIETTYNIDGIHFEIVNWETSFEDVYSDYVRLSSTPIFHELHLATIVPIGEEKTFKKPGLEEFRAAVLEAEFKPSKNEKYLIYSQNDVIVEALDNFLARAEAQYLHEIEFFYEEDEEDEEEDSIMTDCNCGCGKSPDVSMNTMEFDNDTAIIVVNISCEVCEQKLTLKLDSGKAMLDNLVSYVTLCWSKKLKGENIPTYEQDDSFTINDYSNKQGEHHENPI